jgi:hypothetical protein
MLRRDNGTKDRQHKIYGDFAAVPNFHHRFLPQDFSMSDIDDIEYEYIDGVLNVYGIFEQKLYLRNQPIDRPYFKTTYDRTFYKGSSGNLAVDSARINNCALYLIIYDIADSLKRIYRDGSLTIAEASRFYNVQESSKLLKDVYVYKVDTAWTNWLPENYDYLRWKKYTEPEFVQFLYNIRGKTLH